MAAQQGREFLLKVSDGAGGYDTVGGFKTNSLNINGEPVDITNKDSGGFKETLNGGGVVSISTNANGVFMDDAAFQRVHDAVMTNAHLDCQIIVPGLQTYQGNFSVNSLQLDGSNEGVVEYNIDLQSSGTIAVTAAP